MKKSALNFCIWTFVFCSIFALFSFCSSEVPEKELDQEAKKTRDSISTLLPDNLIDADQKVDDCKKILASESFLSEESNKGFSELLGKQKGSFPLPRENFRNFKELQKEKELFDCQILVFLSAFQEKIFTTKLAM